VNIIPKSMTALAMLLVPIILVVNGITNPLIALAAAPIKLSLRPAGDQGEYFDLKMTPGESRELTVQLGNLGSEMVPARTFSADVYSLVNGGFGARLDGEPSGGTTSWLNYPAESLDLPPGTSVARVFTVHVPADAKPGEYQTSLLLQNANPFGNETEAAEVSVAFKQFVRQALVVNIAVSGALVPGMQIGTASQRDVGGNTTVAVGVKNTGNVRLKPFGEFVLMNASGKELSRYPIKMDTVYAGTETTAEMPFNQLLNPGEYTVSASLADASGVTATPAPLALSVAKPDVAVGVADMGPGRAVLDQGAPAAQSPEHGGVEQVGTTTGMIALGISLLGMALILGSLIVRRRARP
jgi:hypothetical protein